MHVPAHSFRYLVAALVVSGSCSFTFGCSLFSGQEPPTPVESADGTDTADGMDTADGTDTADGMDTADNVDNADGVERTDARPFVGDTIEMNYDPNVIMKRAEAFHEKEGYAEAIVEYKHFLELHNTHVLAPYAQYRLALSHFKMLGTIDLDVTPVETAREEFVKLMTDFPDSQYEAEALASIRDCDRHLAQHHFFIGEFYYRKEAYMGALQRFVKILDSYPDLEEAVESKLYIAKTYNELGVLEWARDWAQALVQQHPQHTLRDEGLELLTALYEEHPDLADTDPRNQHVLLASLTPATATRSASQPSRTSSRTIHTTESLPQSGLRSSSTSTPCQVGAWCEVVRTFPHGIPTPQYPATLSRTCSPGTWCE